VKNTISGGVRVGLAMLAIAVMIAAASAVMSGCGGPPTAVRRGTSAAAIGLASMDAPAAEGYQAAHERALAEHETRAGYDAAMRPWNDLETGMRAAHSSLFALDVALDAWGAGGEREWLGLAACTVVSLRHVATLAAALGLELPEQVESGLSMISAIAGAACPGRQ
jgi:hypothetical protein